MSIPSRRPALFLVPMASLVAALLGASAGAAAQTNPLPYELRQPAGRYPVQLITGKDCRSCEPARQLLVQRGIPFTEKRVETNADALALRAQTGALTLPVLLVGQQRVVGLVSQEWHSYLDAAGYPRESRLPANWRQPPAVPLAPPGAADTAPEAPPAPAPAPATVTEPGQPKIRF